MGLPDFPAGLRLGDITADPAAPPGSLGLYTKSLAGKRLLYTRSPNGLIVPLMPHFAFGKAAFWTFAGGSGTFQNVGLETARTGTPTARNFAATNLFTNTRRIAMLGAATAGQTASVRANPPAYIRSVNSTFGGFFEVLRFGVSSATAVASNIIICGMSATTPAAATAPSAHVNFVGACVDAADTTLSMQCRAAAGTVSKVALGANFPGTTLSTDMYELQMYCPPNVTWLAWRVLRMNTGDVATGVFDTAVAHSGSDITTNVTVSANLPAATTYLGPMIYHSNNATAAAVAIDIAAFYIDGDV